MKPTLDALEHDGSQDEVITHRETGGDAGKIAHQGAAKQVINFEQNSHLAPASAPATATATALQLHRRRHRTAPADAPAPSRHGAPPA